MKNEDEDKDDAFQLFDEGIAFLALIGLLFGAFLVLHLVKKLA